MPNERRDTLFAEALALPATERATFLAHACAGNEALHAELTSLLAAHDASEGFFESLARDAAQPLQRSLGTTGAGDDEPLRVGDTVARYRVEARLGRGGMGVVYRATDVRLGRPVALKVLPVSSSGDARARARLLEEARAASALEHPHIGTILDVGTLEGGLSADRMYVAMVYYPGETLADRLARGPVPVAESLRIGRELAGALAAAHEAGLVHRDVKPSNVLLTHPGGSVRLVDFGIAARVGAELPQTTAARGTRRYMSPERSGGAPPDPRADVWSMGLVLRDLLEARPRDHVHPEKDARWRDGASPRHEGPPGGAASPLPEALAQLLHRCLDPDPARRPAHAGEVRSALEALEVTEAVMAGDEGGHPAAAGGYRPGRWFARAFAGPTSRGRALGVGAAGFALFVLAWQLLPRAAATSDEAARWDADGLATNRVLVLPLEDRSADSTLAAFGAMAADFVAEAIAATPFAEAVPAMTALAMVRDGVDAPPGVDRLVHLARPLGAAYVIAGSYVVQGDSLLVRAALSSGRDGRLVRTLPTVAAARAEPAEALAALAQAAVVATAFQLDPLVRTDALVQATPPRWEAYLGYVRAKEHYLAGRYDEALAAFDEAYALDGRFRFPLFYRGMVYLNMERFAELEAVVEELRRAETPQSDPFERQARRVLEAYLSRDLAALYRVHRESERLGMIGPGGLGHFSMGVAAFNVGRPRESITIIRQSDPDRGELRGWPGYFNFLARAHLWLGEFDAALDAADRLQADHPSLDLGTRRAMEALAGLGRVAAVDSVLDAGVRSMPDPGGLLRHAGNVLRSAGLEDEARRHYARATAFERDQLLRAGDTPPPGLRAALAESLLLAGELDEAEAIVRVLAAESPTLMDPVTSLGRIAARRGDAAAVARIDAVLAERATERWNFGAATYRRARLAAALGDAERAAQFLEQAWREGYPIYANVWTDPEFTYVRGHPAVDALLVPRG